MKHVWVVEVVMNDRPSPVDCLPTKHAAKQVEWAWQKSNPQHKFRIRKYVPVEGK